MDTEYNLDDFDFDGLMTFIENNIDFDGDGRFYRGRLADFDGKLVKEESFFNTVFKILGDLDLIKSYGIIRDFGNRAAYDSIRVTT